MRIPVVLFIVPLYAACSPSPAGPAPAPNPDNGLDVVAQCFELQLKGSVATDVRLPRLIELTWQPAPDFVEPGRFKVREPAEDTPQAPLSWWSPRGEVALDLVLGGGYTGYAFSLQRKEGGWSGVGTYFADFGVEPTPAPLPLDLTPQACP